MTARRSARMLEQLARFGLVGGVGALVDIGGTMLFINGGWPPLVARAPAFCAALATTWYLHGAFTFGMPKGLTLGRFGRFSGVALGVAGLNYLIYAGLVSRATWPPLAIAVATVICMGISYLAYRFFAFR